MQTMNKPFAESCEQNKAVILEVIQPLLQQARRVLEIGSGTGQHALHFAAAMPHLEWYPSDRQEHHTGMRLWFDEAACNNIQQPLCLDVIRDEWPGLKVDAVFTANTAHIMHWDEVQAMVAGVGQVLEQGGLFLMYGPFNYNHCYTSDSNERFDAWLKQRDPLSGIRNFEDLQDLAALAGMRLARDYAMPVNNRILSWRKD